MKKRWMMLSIIVVLVIANCQMTAMADVGGSSSGGSSSSRGSSSSSGRRPSYRPSSHLPYRRGYTSQNSPVLKVRN